MAAYLKALSQALDYIIKNRESLAKGEILELTFRFDYPEEVARKFAKTLCDLANLLVDIKVIILKIYKQDQKELILYVMNDKIAEEVTEFLKKQGANINVV